MSFFFEPTLLIQATEQLAKKHRFKSSDLDHPERADPEILSALVKKLRATLPAQLPALVSAMSHMERRLCPGLLSHEEVDVRNRCLICCELMPDDVSSGSLWSAFCVNPHQKDFAPRLVALMKYQLRRKDGGWTGLQIQLINTYSGELNPLCKAFWETSLTRRESSKSTRHDAKIPENTVLSKVLMFYLLLHGGSSYWVHEEPARMLTYFKMMSASSQLKVFAHAHKIFEAVRILELCKSEMILGFAEYLRQHDTMQKALQEHAPQAHAWWRQILIGTELTSFFRDHADNERFVFWESYLPYFVDVKADHKNMRLFMSFEGFGVIEFGITNNAAYVYKQEDFLFFQNKNFSSHRKLPHSALKDTERAIEHISHTGDWQHHTRKKMKSWLAEYNN